MKNYNAFLRLSLLALVALIGDASTTSALATITTPTSIGQNHSTTAGTSLAVAVSAGGVAVGNTIIVTFTMQPGTSRLVSISDTHNAYTLDADVTSASGSTVRTLVFSAPVTTALTSSDTIAVTCPSVLHSAVSIYCVGGLVSASPKDKSATASGSNTAPSSGSSTTLAQANELCWGAIGYASGGTFTVSGTGWAALTKAIAGTAATIQPTYRIVSATTAQTASGRLGTSGSWAAAIVTYRADRTAPTAAITYAPAQTAFKAGTMVTITATFSEPLADSPAVRIAISAVTGGSALAATAMTKVDSTHYTCSYSMQAGNGTARVKMSAGTDLAGNGITGTPTSGASFTVDNVAPATATVTAPVSGSVYRGATVPTSFTGRAADSGTSGCGLNADSTTFTLKRGSDNFYWTGSDWQSSPANLVSAHNATTGSSAAAWTDNVTLPAWSSEADGPYTVQATVTDKVGNAFTGTAVSFTLDNTTPTIALVTAPVDGRTYRTATVPASFTGSAADNASGSGLNANSTTFTLQRGSDNFYWTGSTWQSGVANLATTHGATTGNTAVTWTDNVTLPTWSSTADGIYTVQAKTTDKAGNACSGTAVGFTFDRTAPTAAITYAPAQTAFKAGTMVTITATFSEPLADSPAVKIAISAVTGGSALAATGMTEVDSTHYTYSYSMQAGNGTANVTMSVGTDLAGNGITGTPASGASFTVDNTAPGAPTGFAMTAASDTGSSSSDRITSDTTPVFTGTAAANSTVSIFDGATQIGSGAAAAFASPGITVSILADGVHSLTAKATDVVGNTSVASTALNVTIDTASPVAPSTPALAVSSDTGTLGDNITTVHTPAFTGTVEPGSTVTIYSDGVAVGTGSAAAFSSPGITVSTLTTGQHSISASATDAAGNSSTASGILGVFLGDAVGPTGIGTASNTTANGNLAVTVAGAGVAVGNTIFVTVAMDPGPATQLGVSVADSKNNAYRSPADADARVRNASDTTGVRTLVFSAPVTTALGSGDSITVTFSANVTAKAMSAFWVSGLVSALPKDQAASTASSTSGSTGPNSGATATTSQPDEILIGAIGIEGSGTGFSQGSGFATMGGVSAGTSITLEPGFRVVNSRGTYADSATISSARWAADIVSYKIAVPTVSSIVRADGDSTSANLLHFTVTFSKTVYGVDAGDFSFVQANGVSGATIIGLTGDGTTYVVTADRGSGGGTLGLNLADRDTIVDANGNPLGGTGTTGAQDGSFAGEAYTIVLPTTTTGASASATYGDASVGLSATVSPSPGSGTVTFYIDGGPVGTGSVEAGSGVATLNYDPSSLCAGGHSIRAEFAASTYYSASSSDPEAGGTLTVNKATPVVTWSNPAEIAYNTPLSGTQLNAAAGAVAGTFVYTPASGTVLGAGNGQSLSVQFTPTDTTDYNTPSPKSVTINVLKATPTAALAVNNSPQMYDGTGKSATVEITTHSVSGTVGNIRTGAAASQTEAGTYSVTADFVPNDSANYITLTAQPAGDFVIYPRLSARVATASLSGYVGAGANPSITISCEAKAGDTEVGREDVEVPTTVVDSTGSGFDLTVGVPSATTSISLKPRFYLRKKFKVTVTGNEATIDLSSATFLGGDVYTAQGNNQVDGNDYAWLRYWWENTYAQWREAVGTDPTHIYDLNGDGKTDANDFPDINGDGVIDSHDYDILKGGWYQQGDDE